MLRAWTLTCILISAALVFGRATRLQAAPLLPEFQISTTSFAFGGLDQSPKAAAGPDGNFLVVWAGGPSPSGPTIEGQRVSPTGALLGVEFQISSSTPAIPIHYQPEVAFDSTGQALVVWQKFDDIAAQRLDASGGFIGSEFVISDTYDGEFGPAFAFGPSGDSIVVWSSTGSSGSDSSDLSIQARRFGSDDVPIGSRFQLNTTTTGDQAFPSISMASDGSAVAVWRDRGPFVRAQRLTSSGTLLGAEFLVSSYGNIQTEPVVVHAPNGDFLIVWSGKEIPSPHLCCGISAQRYDSSGGALGAAFQVSAFALDHTQPNVAFDSTGEFVVAWWDMTDEIGLYALGRRFDTGGSPVDSEFLIGTAYPRTPAVAFNQDDRLLVVWELPQKIFGQRAGTINVPALGSVGLLGLAAIALAAGMRSLRRDR